MLDEEKAITKPWGLNHLLILALISIGFVAACTVSEDSESILVNAQFTITPPVPTMAHIATIKTVPTPTFTPTPPIIPPTGNYNFSACLGKRAKISFGVDADLELVATQLAESSFYEPDMQNQLWGHLSSQVDEPKDDQGNPVPYGFHLDTVYDICLKKGVHSGMQLEGVQWYIPIKNMPQVVESVCLNRYHEIPYFPPVLTQFNINENIPLVDFLETLGNLHPCYGYLFNEKQALSNFPSVREYIGEQELNVVYNHLANQEASIWQEADGTPWIGSGTFELFLVGIYIPTIDIKAFMLPFDLSLTMSD